MAKKVLERRRIREEDGLRRRRKKNPLGQWRSKARPSGYRCTVHPEAEGGDGSYQSWWLKLRWAAEGVSARQGQPGQGISSFGMVKDGEERKRHVPIERQLDVLGAFVGNRR
ncbi:hypothetical protein Ahy_A10g048380 isoform B [Arachis hypogaea]|uniref:Uncharacterized protein n=1 Tax=Arachis hypogaea TaxID=3818 RepID=A0A445B4Z3_ARAHY|nr:hypothetical protein Ahy_A10g048380 isoform B [Arachis hypogaea]